MSGPLDTLRAYLAARDAAEPGVAQAMRSRVLTGSGDEVVLLLHGLTASPPAWTAIAAALNARGATVVVPRLPLHGHADRLTTALRDLSIELLCADLRAVVTAVIALGKPIVIGGHSLGGTLAIHAAATLAGIERIVAIAPFLGISRVPHELHPALLPIVRRLPNAFLWWDPLERDRQLPDHGYPRYPLHALAVGIGIAELAYADATRPPRASAIDLVVNARETSVDNRAVRRLAARWRAAGANIALHELSGLPPSHDIIEPGRPSSLRVRDVLVRLLCGERNGSDTVTHVV